MANIPKAKTERNQRIFNMVTKDKMSQAKVARIMQISAGRVQQIISRFKRNNA